MKPLRERTDNSPSPVDRRIAASRTQEKRGAALHGGRRNSGSGNGIRKGDVRLDRSYLIEYKRTDKNQITLRKDDLDTLWNNAYAEGREPALGIEIGGKDWVLTTASEFERRRGH